MDFIAGNTEFANKFADTKCLLILLGVQSEREASALGEVR